LRAFDCPALNPSSTSCWITSFPFKQLDRNSSASLVRRLRSATLSDQGSRGYTDKIFLRGAPLGAWNLARPFTSTSILRSAFDRAFHTPSSHTLELYGARVSYLVLVGGTTCSCGTRGR
jgi:hypothetical protein